MPERPVAFAGWSVESNLPDGIAQRFAPEALELTFHRSEANFWRLLHPLEPDGDFVISTKIDFLPTSGTLAGLWLEGKQGRLRLIRSDLNGGSLTAEHVGRNQVSLPEFPGCPPVTLRLELKNKKIHASISRDDIVFKTLALTVNVSDLGTGLRFGIHAERRTWGNANTFPVARYFYVRRDVRHLTDFRSQ